VEAAVHDHALDARRAEPAREHVGGALRIAQPARVEVDRGVAGLGPGVDREVRLLDQEHARHALRAEAMEAAVEHPRARRVGRVAQEDLEAGHVVEDDRVAPAVLDEQVVAERVHAPRCP
jgi:hypothetical protein